MQLTRETFTGPWAGLPVAWTEFDTFDEQTYRGDVARCCRAGIPGVYTGGTTGEFYAMELDEFRAVARATVEECHAHGTPAMVGVSATWTLGACRRAAFAAEIGADAIQVALPFWLEVPDDQVVPFFREVSAAAGGLPLSIYETTRTKKALSLDQHQAIKEAVPNYLMVKATAGTVGSTPEGCREISEFANVFVGENRWGELGRVGAAGGCSSVVYWLPKLMLHHWQLLREKEWDALDASCARLEGLLQLLFRLSEGRGFTDSAFDRLGALAGGFLGTSLHLHKPYPSPTPDDVAAVRRYLEAHFADVL